ncbi:hypothetical protein [Citrobacter sp. U14242]|uniref:hypothetical protein n=1 Tax=Citrobacter sp. U14242 TaxID=3390192 RepID=UPI00397E1B64
MQIHGHTINLRTIGEHIKDAGRSVRNHFTAHFRGANNNAGADARFNESINNGCKQIQALVGHATADKHISINGEFRTAQNSATLGSKKNITKELSADHLVPGTGAILKKALSEKACFTLSENSPGAFIEGLKNKISTLGTDDQKTVKNILVTFGKTLNAGGEQEVEGGILKEFHSSAITMAVETLAVWGGNKNEAPVV